MMNEFYFPAMAPPQKFAPANNNNNKLKSPHLHTTSLMADAHPQIWKMNQHPNFMTQASFAKEIFSKLQEPPATQFDLPLTREQLEKLNLDQMMPVTCATVQAIGLAEYLDNIQRVAPDEELNTPVYISCKDILDSQRADRMAPAAEAATAASKVPTLTVNKEEAKGEASGLTTSSFIPTAINSIKSLFGTMLKLPTMIMGSLSELNAGPMNATTSTTTTTTQDDNEVDHDVDEDDGDRSCFNDADLFDFEDAYDYVWNSDAIIKLLDSLSIDDADDDDEREAIVDDNAEMREMTAVWEEPLHVNVEGEREQLLQSSPKLLPNDTEFVPEVLILSPKLPLIASPPPSPLAAAPPSPTITDSCESVGKRDIGEGSSVDAVAEDTPTAVGATQSQPGLPSTEGTSQSAEEVGRREQVKQKRKFRMATGSKPHVQSEPIAMKRKRMVQQQHQQYHPEPRNLYRQAKQTMDKNRREKQRHNIHVDMCEDYNDGMLDGSESLDVQDVRLEEELLPLTARNLTQPCCWMVATSSPKRRSSSSNSFCLSTSYDSDFPCISVPNDGNVEEEEEDDEVEKEVQDGGAEEEPKYIIRGNCVFFEIPNSPLRRRQVKPPPQLRHIFSSSVGSSLASPGSSFEAGKFWDHSPTPRRTSMSDCSDDVVEFIRGSDYDSDEDEFSTEEEEETDEDETEEEEDGDSDDDEDGIDRRSSVSGRSSTLKRTDDVPVLGPEEKKVRFSSGEPQVRTLRAWDYAHRQARKGHWQEVGRDRVRFGERIRRAENELRAVLMPTHRFRIYRQRFVVDNPAR